MATVSVIILTANRRPLLQRALDALETGERSPDQVVVVNNRSKDDTAEFLSGASYSFDLTVIDGPDGSFTECRNAGVAAAECDLVAFLDDDCEADRFWLARMIDVLESKEWIAAGGPVMPADALPSPDWYSPELAWTIGCSTPAFFTSLAGRLELPTTSNLIFRREIAAEFPFKDVSQDTGSTTWNYEYSREDSQFWRDLRRAGKPVGTVQDAIIWHHIPFERIDLERARERARQDGRGFWRRERLREEVRPAARDVVFSPIAAWNAVQRDSMPLDQAWQAQSVWARRQLAFLEYAVDDHNHGVSPQSRLGDYLLESGRALSSVAKSAARNIASLGMTVLGNDIEIPTIDNPPRRLVVVLHDMLGDTVLALPMLRQLASSFPESDIFILTGPSSSPILRNNAPESCEVVEIPDEARGHSPAAAYKLHDLLRQYMPDCILVAYCHGLAPAPFFLLGSVPVIAWPEDNGFGQKVYGDLLSANVEKTFQKAETAALLDLLAPFEIPTKVERPKLHPSDSARERCERILNCAGVEPKEYAFLHVDPATRAKHWPVDRFFKLADSLHEMGLAVFMEGSTAGRAETEAERTSRPWCHSLHGLLDTDELAAVIEGACLFVGCDSGPAHVAQAVRTPGAFLFGASAHYRWGPLPPLSGERGLPRWEILAASPGDWLLEETRGLAFNHALGLLDSDDVLSSIRRILEDGENFSELSERH